MRDALALWRGRAVRRPRRGRRRGGGGGPARRAAARRPRGARLRRAGGRSAPRGRRRAGGAGRRAPVPRTVLRPADGGAVPVRPAGRGAGGVRRRPASVWPTSSGSTPVPSCRRSPRASSVRIRVLLGGRERPPPAASVTRSGQRAGPHGLPTPSSRRRPGPADGGPYLGGGPAGRRLAGGRRWRPAAACCSPARRGSARPGSSRGWRDRVAGEGTPVLVGRCDCSGTRLPPDRRRAADQRGGPTGARRRAGGRAWPRSSRC